MRTARLCVSLTPGKLDEIFSSDLIGADLVEVRLDYLSDPQKSIHTRWDRLPLPVIATCRGKERGGKFEGSIEEETRILKSAAENGAKFVDIDFRFARPFAGAQVIGSYHDFAGTPENLGAVLDQTCAGAADIGKVATTVNSWADNRRLLETMSIPRNKPVIVAGMGDAGQITRILGPSRGSFLTYATPGTGIAAAPGQLTIREMLDVYRIRRVRGSSRLIGVVGMPLGHSLSPVIHNRAFAALDLDFVYLKLPTTDVKDFFDNAEAIGIEGFSVTIPHKTAVIKFLNGQTPEALEAGAVNTVYKRDGKWMGDNTDVHGVRVALAAAGIDPSDKTVVILGKGGASKAAQVAVKEAKSVTVLSRAEVRDAGSYRCDLLINATPVGMYPNVDTAPFDGAIHANVVFDMVYNPPITRLLRSAADQGKTIVQGTTMFLAQAARQFEIWTGVEAPGDIYMEKAL
jgi:3-dehydroquinate dehydratase / shikimate dehydrogenase